MVKVEHFTSATHASNPQQREHQKDTRTKSSSESHQFPPVRTVRVTHTRLNPTCALNGVIADTAVLTLSLAFPTLNTDTVSERLRRWTRNPLGSARRGSNPLGVVLLPHLLPVSAVAQAIARPSSSTVAATPQHMNQHKKSQRQSALPERPC